MVCNLNFKTECALLWHSLVNIQKSDLYGADRRHLPIDEDGCDELIDTGWVGEKYQPGRSFVFLDAMPSHQAHDDKKVYGEALLKFTGIKRDEEIKAGFWQLMKAYKKERSAHKNWSNNIELVCRELGVSVDSIAFLYAIPFFMRGNKWPASTVRDGAWENILSHQFRLLNPKGIIAIHRKADFFLHKPAESTVPKVYIKQRKDNEKELLDEALDSINYFMETRLKIREKVNMGIGG